MYLLINLSQKNQINLSLFDSKTKKDWQSEGPNRDLLVSIDQFLKKALVEHSLSGKKLNKKDVQGIMVVVGAGGFTSTRISTVIANAFSYAQAIPVLCITENQVDSIQDLIPKLLDQPKDQFISATYSGEPNIG